MESIILKLESGQTLTTPKPNDYEALKAMTEKIIGSNEIDLFYD